MTQVAESEVITGNVKDIVNRLSRDMTRAPFSIHPQNERRQPVQYVSTFAYSSQQHDELSFSIGETIELIEEVEDGWSKGRLKSTGAIGMFPTNFVTIKSTSIVSNSTSRPKVSTNEVNMRSEPKAIERTPSTVLPDQMSLPKTDPKILIPSVISAVPSTTTNVENSEGKTKEMARVKFVYNPQHLDELALLELDVLINITSKSCGDAGWFEGELRGKRGVFPDNFVELVQVPLDTESGTKYAQTTSTVRQSSLDRLINKPPPANPPQPVVPPKPVNLKPEPVIPTLAPTTTTTVPSSTPGTISANKNSFAALREKMSTNLKVVAPEKLASIQTKQLTSEGRSQSTEGLLNENGAEPTFDESSADKVSELQHITKHRARPPKSRPMSMVMNRNRSSDESPVRLSSPTTTMSTSMFVATPTVVKQQEATTTPFKTVAIPPNIVPPSSAMKPALRPIVSGIDSSGDTPKKSASPDGTKSSERMTSPVSTTQTSEYVTRAEYDILLDRVRVLEARLMAIEKMRL